MDDDFLVKCLLACGRIEAPVAYPDAPYHLSDVRFSYEIPGDREWPARLDEFWLYVRFYNGHATRWLGLSAVWLDAPAGEQEYAYFELPVAFMPDTQVHSRGWNLSTVSFPGPGRHEFRLTDENARLLANEVITVWSEP